MAGSTDREPQPGRHSGYAVQSISGAGRALSWMEAANDSVYGPQWTHPHPAFSADGKYVTFASDRTGQTQVYVVEV